MRTLLVLTAMTLAGALVLSACLSAPQCRRELYTMLNGHPLFIG